jgi:hypothetical protein
LTTIKARVATWADIEVKGCFWGEDLGASLKADGASVPTFDATRALGIGAEKIGEPDAGLWALLLNDPLAELRLLALAAGNTARKAHLFEPQGAALWRTFVAFCRTPHNELTEPLREDLTRASLGGAFASAREALASSEVCREILSEASEPLGEYRAAVARAVVAFAVSLDPGLDPEDRLADDQRERIVALIVEALGGSERGLESRLGQHGWALVKAVGTFGAKRYRGKFTSAVARTIGDILVYQARGEAIRSAVAQAIYEAGNQVVLLAHSLGGVAAVDLLAADTGLYPHIKLFVTVGSQSPFLYEIGAMHNLPFGCQLPSAHNFPRWLNFYDLSDFLSYVGNHPRLFGDRIQDIQVFSGKPFPESHSWYFHNPHVWETIREHLNERRQG